MNNEDSISWEWLDNKTRYRYEEKPRWTLLYSKAEPNKVQVHVDMDTKPTSYVIGLFINRALLPAQVHKTAVCIQLENWGEPYAKWTADLINNEASE